MIDSGTSAGRPSLAGGATGARHVRDLVAVALDAVTEASAARTGPAPAGGPAAVADALAAALARRGAGPANGSGGGPRGGSGGVPANGSADESGGSGTHRLDLLPEHGIGAAAALADLSAALTAGSVDPAHPWCAAHLHGPPLAVAAAADLVASVINPSMDSWDQAPVASELERGLTAALARLCFPAEPDPDALVTSGGTESNLLGLLLARSAGATRPVCGRNAHHSVRRAAWLLGLPAPLLVDTEHGRLRPDHLATVLDSVDGRPVLVATAGTTDTGAIDPLPELAALAERAGAWLHVDASYAGAALFSDRLAPLLDGLARADTVSLDLHKFGWQPIAAGILAARQVSSVAPLDIRADYLNPDDDIEAGLPDLLGRSIRTSRRADAFKIAVTLRALGRAGVARLVETCCRVALELASTIERRPDLVLWGEPTLSTVLFRPAVAGPDAEGDAVVAAVRRRLLEAGTAVLGRATVDSRVWLKLTLLNPEVDRDACLGLLDLVAATATEIARPSRVLP